MLEPNISPNDLNFDFWPFFRTNLTLVVTFEPKENDHSYFTWIPCVAFEAKKIEHS